MPAWTPTISILFIVASSVENHTTCNFLVANGLDINIKVDWISDILITAVEQNHLAWVRFCLENGANPNLNLDLDIYSPLATAARNDSVKVVSLLPKYNATLEYNSALALAAKHGKLYMVMFLLKKGAFVDENCVTNSLDTDEEDDGETALHLVKKGQVDIFKYLLKSGANRNLKADKGRTPLEKFLEIKDMKLLEALKDQIP